ncbi:NYN domain-containing protein [uncultured Thiocystis sp.]|uniref:NYN domain-containing protein n=1 Tax=uncultured Thiocystis sp. TaxID=1202134 RepID=UPI0025F96A89|nr:NYN domain-containing protein [uncultured Thiocystis sp.]
MEAKIISATIAGNNQGPQIDHWRRELLAAIPDLVVQALPAPHRKQGADIALLMALGAELERHLRERVVVVIVSRDDLLIGAAEHAKARGCRALIAYADGEIPTARNAHLTTLLLPAVAKANPVARPVSATTQPAVPVVTAPAVTPTPTSKGEGTSVAAQLRAMCTKQPGGGYTATDVGQALFKLGYDKAARARFLQSLPGLTTRGTGANKILVF